MALTDEHEHDNIIRLDLQGRLLKADFERVEQQLESEIQRQGSVRLLIVLDRFGGWDPGARACCARRCCRRRATAPRARGG